MERIKVIVLVVDSHKLTDNNIPFLIGSYLGLICQMIPDLSCGTISALSFLIPAVIYSIGLPSSDWTDEQITTP